LSGFQQLDKERREFYRYSRGLSVGCGW